jgi:hypothetical protein
MLRETSSRASGKISLHSLPSRDAERVVNLLKVVTLPSGPDNRENTVLLPGNKPLLPCFNAYIATVNKYPKKVIAVIKNISEIQFFIFH